LELGIRQRFEQLDPPAIGSGLNNPNPDLPASRFEKIRSQIHRAVLDQMDLRRMDNVPADKLRMEVRALSQNLMDESKLALNEMERRQIIQGIQDEILGLGPIEPLLSDSSVSDILVNGPRQIYVERHGKIEITPVQFDNDQHLLRVIDRIVSRVGRRVDEMSPMVDARLPDGSRVNAVIPPLAIDGPLLSIRRFSATPLTIHDLLAFDTLSPEIADLIQGLVKARVNLLVSGGTGSGKTTLLNVMSASIPADERIITIEDAAELQLQQPHVVRMESRPENIEGKGEISQRALLINSLRMRPDRIILGEVRGSEVLDMLQAMNTGHDGSMTTIHANSARDAITRLEHGWIESRSTVHAPTNQCGLVGGDSGFAPVRWQAQSDQLAGNHRHGGRRHHDAGNFFIRANRPERRGLCTRSIFGLGHTPSIHAAPDQKRHPLA
jgi:pilus assembly protein CpaF